MQWYVNVGIFKFKSQNLIQFMMEVNENNVGLFL